MVNSKRNISKLKLNNTAKITGGARLPNIFGRSSDKTNGKQLVNYSLVKFEKNNQSNSHVKHLIKKQMLITLDKIKENTEKGETKESLELSKDNITTNIKTKYPELKYYNDFEENVKQFFIEYRIFDKRADIFFSMQGDLRDIYPTEKLMLPIHFDIPKKYEEEEEFNISQNDIDYIQGLFVKFPVGSNFVCYYDYLMGKDYLYFTSDQFYDGKYRTFMRIKLLPDWKLKTDVEIASEYKNIVEHFQKLIDEEISEVENKVTPGMLGDALTARLEDEEIEFPIPTIPELDIPSARRAEVRLSLAGLNRLFSKSSLVEQINLDKFSIPDKKEKMEHPDLSKFKINVLYLMQNEIFIKAIVNQIKNFQTAYLKDYQKYADEKDKTVSFDAGPDPGLQILYKEIEDLDKEKIKDQKEKHELEKSNVELASKKQKITRELEKAKAAAASAAAEEEDKAAAKAAKAKEAPAAAEAKAAEAKAAEAKADKAAEAKAAEAKAAADRAVAWRPSMAAAAESAADAESAAAAERALRAAEKERMAAVEAPAAAEPVAAAAAESAAGRAGMDSGGEGASSGGAKKQKFIIEKDNGEDQLVKIKDDDKFTEDDKLAFVEFVYYSTYAFYHVFSKKLRVRESEMKKFFNDYIDGIMNMFKKKFKTIIDNSSIYISIARALGITFEKKLAAAFNAKTIKQASISNDITRDKHAAIDQNKVSTLNESGEIEEELRKDRIFSTDSFFNLKSQKIRNYIFKTYNNIDDLRTAMDDTSLGNRQFKIASRLDYRFTVEILGKQPMKQGMIENAQVRQALADIFSGNFGMFRNILDDIDKAIDEFDGINIKEIHEKLQQRLPKLASFGPTGMVFEFDKGLLEMGLDQEDLLKQQITQKTHELRILQQKKEKLDKLNPSA